MVINGLTIAESTGHGQACKGNKKTSTIQVREPCNGGYLLLKQFRFTVGNTTSKEKAIQKARDFATERK